MSNTIDWTKVVKGTKFEMTSNRAHSARVGDIVTFDKLDYDEDPVFINIRNNVVFYLCKETAHERVKKFDTLLDGAWIVWNSQGSTLASSEEQAKQEAELLLDLFGDQPVYIAQATAYVVKEDKVWH